MTDTKHPDYEAMARERIAELEPKRGGRDVGAVYRRQAYGDLAQRVGSGR